ncbi:hypothetical protein WK24_01345 [Burkholderia vietnamiensis]|uniref:inovirus-type Gp2 protein n=1 Tax=Burkholderia vietnamiensis TaxID=60552 RepID=UPI000755521E|nr:inovirus-type Gp2 protein [Burkholderia vietnamiensis]KVR68753.1 hypothetical protein WK24_01345 [Burkholderia vietnamiensis]HDR9149369.1 inovirus-type Gp2 protein [Burkholderia vietnamiensis]
MADRVLSSSKVDDNESWTIEPYQAWIFNDMQGGVVSTRIASEDSMAGNVEYITQFVKRLIYSRRQLLSLVPAKMIRSKRPNMKLIKASKGGECFLTCLGIDLDRIIDKYPDIGKHNRYFGLFYDAVMCEVAFENATASLAKVARLEWLSFDDKNLLPDRALALFVDYSNEAIEQIRQEGNSDAFKDWQAAIERQPKENEGRLLSLIDAALSVNHHLLVLRFDLGYSQFYCDPELSGGMAVSYEEMREHRVALRRFLKRDLKKRLLPRACKGMVFAVKMEFGLDKTFHFHVIVILNGDVVCKDVLITEMICDQWNRVITTGKGGACNCNSKQYRLKGIGSVRRKDAEKLNILKTVVAPYITKPDYYSKMVKPDGHRTFWPSHPPQIEAKPKGRKRESEGL